MKFDLNIFTNAIITAFEWTVMPFVRALQNPTVGNVLDALQHGFSLAGYGNIKIASRIAKGMMVGKAAYNMKINCLSVSDVKL